MPRFDKLIFEQTNQILKPISETIATKFLKFLGIYNYFPGNIRMESSDSQVYNDKDEDGRIKVNQDRCDIIMNPNYNPKETEWDVFSSKSANQNGIPDGFFNGDFPIFIDKANKITMHQFCIPCSVKLDFSLKFQSIEKADIVSAAIFQRIMNESIHQYSDVVFTYPIPDVLFWALYKFYKMQNLDPVTLPFKKYLEIGSNSVFGTIANRDDQTIRQNVVLQNNINVLCNATYESDTPEAEKKGKITDRYIIDFSLMYQFSKPNSLTLSYPYMINNKPIPKILIPNSNKMKTEDLGGVHPNIAMNRTLFNYQQYLDIDHKYPLVQYPDIGYNKLKLNTTMESILTYKPLFVSLLQIETNVTPNRIFINLEADVFPLIKDYITNEIRKVLITHSDTDLCLFLGLFNFSIMKNDYYPVSYDRMTIDKTNKTITVNTNLDLKSEYKLIINQVKNIKRLKGNYIKEMINNPEYWDIIIYLNLKYLIKHGYITATKSGYNSNDKPASNANSISNVHFYRNSYKIFDYTIYPKR